MDTQASTRPEKKGFWENLMRVGKAVADGMNDTSSVKPGRTRNKKSGVHGWKAPATKPCNGC